VFCVNSISCLIWLGCQYQCKWLTGMTYDVLTGTLNPTHTLTQCGGGAPCNVSLAQTCNTSTQHKLSATISSVLNKLRCARPKCGRHSFIEGSSLVHSWADQLKRTAFIFFKKLRRSNSWTWPRHRCPVFVELRTWVRRWPEPPFACPVSDKHDIMRRLQLPYDFD